MNLRLLVAFFTILLLTDARAADKRYLYAATPGIRNYLDYGGHGVVVFDIDNNHKFVKRIPTQGLAADGKPSNVKGIAANAKTQRLYITTLQKMRCLDLITEKVLWEKSYAGGCDRLALAPDGSKMFLPSLEQGHWHVVDAISGEVLDRIETASGAHNTIYALDGKHAYLAGLRSPLLRVADASTHKVVKEIGPFDNFIRPFTVSKTRCYVNLNGLLGFEIGDLQTGKKLHRIEVQGFKTGPVKRHSCPSHGVGLTPDEKEIWVTDAHNSRMHIFDNTQDPPKQIHSIELRDQPGWITFSLDGKYAYPSTGDIIDIKSRKIITSLTDETGAALQSEKMVEIHFNDAGKVTKTGDQFGLGRAN